MSVSAHFAFMAAGKRSVTIDLTHRPGQQVFRRLVDASDVLITDAAAGEMEALGLGYEALLARHPGLVYTSVTPFGLTGPRRHWRGSDLVGWAASGALPAIGDADRAPLAPGGGLAYMTGALNAAMGAMGALMAKRASGPGSARRRLVAGSGAQREHGSEPDGGARRWLRPRAQREASTRWARSATTPRRTAR